MEEDQSPAGLEDQAPPEALQMPVVEDLPMPMPEELQRRRRRSSMRTRARGVFWIVWPFGLLLLAGLLSAGVVALLEYTPDPPPEVREVQPQSGQGESDRSGFDRGADEFGEPTRALPLSPDEELAPLSLDGERGIDEVDLQRILPTSVLDGAAEQSGRAPGDAMRRPLSFHAPLATPAGATIVPEPGSGILVGLGLGLFGVRSAIG